MSAELRLEGLDDEQRRAVTSPGAPLRVLAGPGAGKTRVLTHRIAHRAESDDLDPRRVLALTFTRRAANELRTRLNRLGLRDVGAIGTFHAVALAQLRRHRLDSGARVPTVLGSRRGIIGELIDAGPDPGVGAGVVHSEIDWALAQGLEPHQYGGDRGARRVGSRAAGAIAELMERFTVAKRRRGVWDFDDLIAEATQLLRTDARFREAQHWLFRHVFVDEFQDLNQPQFDLLTEWVGDRDDLFVVGDADQAIYGWNGADSGFLVDFERFFPGGETVRLTTNHRSDPGIVAAADSVLGRASSSAATAVRSPHTPTVTEYRSETEEAVGIARRIRWSREPGTRWGSFAVLTRTNDQLLAIASAMDQLDVPHRIRGRGGMLRIPAVAEITDQLAEAGPDIAAVAADLVAELDEGPAAVVARLALDYVREDPDPHGHAFRQWLHTVRPGDLDGALDAVDLVTFHAAKGLEWPHVVIAGVEDGLVPIGDDPEERRLFYVAITRAERTLHLTWATTRTRNGVATPRTRSPMLDLVELSTSDPSPVPPARASEMLRDARAAVVDNSPSRAAARRLRDWRDEAARRRRVSPAALLPDAALERVARAQPTTPGELAEASQLSPTRLARVSDEILAVLRPASA